MKQDDSFSENLKHAIAYLMKGHVGTCLVLSSYKVAAVLKENFGTDVNISKVGRFISRFAKINNLERLGTNVPKFKIVRDQFDKITFDIPKTKIDPAV
ncbi:MAG: hypothetical protein GYA24_09105 [Candidatus Lokiarchaeota archaeon]|nr:hypothetical protein [Candidatus Lokiarchaeota archaeon]